MPLHGDTLMDEHSSMEETAWLADELILNAMIGELPSILELDIAYKEKIYWIITKLYRVCDKENREFLLGRYPEAWRKMDKQYPLSGISNELHNYFKITS